MKEENKTRKNWGGIDVFKFFFAFIVVFNHTVIINNPGLLKFKLLFTDLAVPFFFLATGFFIGMKLLKNEENLTEILKSKIIGAIKIYLTWVVIYLPITLYNLLTNDKGIVYDIFSFLKGVFIVGENFDSWPLWYMLSIIYSLIFILILMKKIKSEKLRIIIISMTFVLSQIISILIDNIDSLHGILYNISDILTKTLMSGRLLTGILYIYIGMKLPQMKKHINNKIAICEIIMLDVITLFVNTYVRNFVVVIISTLLFVLSTNIDLKNIKTLFYRKASTIMYFTHMIFYFIFSITIFHNKSYRGFDIYTMVIICTLVLSVIITEIQKRKNSKFLKLLFG